VKEQLMRGMKVGDTTFKVHLDGYNLLPFLTGQTTEDPRKEFFYWNDDCDLVALRYDNWKMVFAEQKSPGTLDLWAEPFTPLRVPRLFNLRTDPYERAIITSNTYFDWMFDRVYLMVPAQAVVGKFIATFQEFPPSQRSGSFSIDQVLDKMKEGATGSH